MCSPKHIIGCQAIDLRTERDGLRVGPLLRAAHASVRSYIPGLNAESSPPVTIEVESLLSPCDKVYCSRL